MSRRVFLIIVTMLSSCARPCRRADVERVLTSCRVEPAGTPGYTACVNAGLTPPPSFDFVQPAVDACSAAGNAPFYECLSTKAATCSPWNLDGGLDAALTSCSDALGRPGGRWAIRTKTDQEFDACVDTCDSSRQACSGACPTSSWGTCAACDEQCAMTYQRCYDGCY